jgi:hypothetical protein
MNRQIIPLLIVALFATSFYFYRPPEGSWSYAPIFLSRDDLERSVKYVPEAREMVETGKIYYRAPYIYVNERYKGVHVINNSDPFHPIREGFVVAPGCIDMAVKGNILYVDNSVDLVSFDLDRKEVTKRIREVFPEPLPPEDFLYYGQIDRPLGFVLVEWKRINR